MTKAANTCRLYLIQESNPHKAFEQYIKDHMISGQPMPYYIQGVKDFITASKVLESDILAIKAERERVENREESKQTDLDKIKLLDAMVIFQTYKIAKTNEQKMELCDLYHSVNSKEFNGITESQIYMAKEYQLI